MIICANAIAGAIYNQTPIYKFVVSAIMIIDRSRSRALISVTPPHPSPIKNQVEDEDAMVKHHSLELHLAKAKDHGFHAHLKDDDQFTPDESELHLYEVTKEHMLKTNKDGTVIEEGINIMHRGKPADQEELQEVFDKQKESNGAAGNERVAKRLRENQWEGLSRLMHVNVGVHGDGLLNLVEACLIRRETLQQLVLDVSLQARPRSAGSRLLRFVPVPQSACSSAARRRVGVEFARSSACDARYCEHTPTSCPCCRCPSSRKPSGS